jgi:DtxR family Mn-dependent transcriptional regulator
MRKTSKRMDEVLEAIWSCSETERATLERVREVTVGGLTDELLNLMCKNGLVAIDGAGPGAILSITSEAEPIARRVMRSHRLAERLVCDVLGASLESAEAAACEFEHTLSHDLTDSICTLLGHPRFCPHGRPIPDGNCCRQVLDEITPVVVSALQLGIGEQANVAYVASSSPSLSHQLASLGIAPGVAVRLHQRWPSVVLTVEETEVALEEAIAANIYVRRDNS